MKQQKATILTLLLIFITLHTLPAQKTTASSRARQQVSSKTQIVTTVNDKSRTVNWSRDLYATTDHTNFRRNPIFLQFIDFTKPDYGLLNACIFFLTNEKRVEQKLPALKYAAQLEIMAWNHSKSMGEGDWLEHKNPIDKYRYSTSDRGKLAGIANPNVGENIALVSEGYFGDTESYLELAEFFVNGWMDSPGHRKNILDRRALQLGCGLFKNNKDDWYGTQNFQGINLIEHTTATDKLP